MTSLTDITPELMAGSYPIFYHRYKDTWHTGNTWVFDLTYFWRSQRSKFKMAPLAGTFHYYNYLTKNILTLCLVCEHISSHHLRFYQTSARSEFKYGHQADILENQLRAIDPKLCTYAPLGKSRPNFGPVWLLAWPPGGQNQKLI
jgi:hypothetical protein